MADFRKAFFPTEDEKTQQKELVNKLLDERIVYYISQGFSEKVAKEKIDNELIEYSKRGYYS